MDYIYRPFELRRNGQFTIIADVREKTPWLFRSQWNLIKFDYSRLKKLYNADYTIQGGEDYIAIERKSVKDFIGTLSLEKTLQGSTRRNRFELELERMQGAVQNCYVIAEVPLSRILKTTGDISTVNKTLLLRAIVRLKRRYPKIKWEFYENREAAEARAFYLLVAAYKTLKKDGIL